MLVLRPETVAAAALFSLVAIGCAGDETVPSIDSTAIKADGGDADAVASCNDLANTAPITHPTCNNSCPGCPTTGTPALKDGTYALRNLVLYSVDCASLTTANVRGRLRVAGNVMDLVIAQPGAAIGDIETTRMQYTFTFSNGALSLQWTCAPAGGPAASQGVNYSSDGKLFRFSILPGTHGDTVFALE
jgi:hypothetical protein